MPHEPRADITIVNNGEPETLDPALLTGIPEMRIVIGLFEGLARLDPKTAQPIPGLGIALPVFVPPLSAAAVALVLSRRNAPALAYIGGSIGCLIGADLLNLGEIQGLGAPVASIGGAGTFDGIFLTGAFAVLLASIFSPLSNPDGNVTRQAMHTLP